MNQIMHVSSADEWAIHNRASDVIFAQGENLSRTGTYNTGLNTYEQVMQYAESLAAELVVARYFGLDFDINEFKGKEKADVGKGIEVRWTSYINGSLIIYPNDRDNDVAVMVVGRSPTYQITGWLPVTSAKKPRFRNLHQDTWWVDQGNLRSIELLKESHYAASHL